MKSTRILLLLAGSVLLRGQISATHPDGRLRIFVGNSETWESTSFGSSAANRTFANSMSGSQSGTVKLTVATMKQIGDHCKDSVVVVNRPDNADLFVRVDHNRGMWSIHEDMAVFNRAGEMVFAASSGKLSRDVSRFCKSPAVFPQPEKKTKKAKP